MASSTLAPGTHADVAQLVRALPCHGRGRGFEPLRRRGCIGGMAERSMALPC
jgi:hypothetical protein